MSNTKREIFLSALSLLFFVAMVVGITRQVYAATVADQIGYYTTTNNTISFSRSLTPTSTLSGGSTVSQTTNADGSIALTIANSPGYSDSGFYLNAGTLGDLKGVLAKSSASSGPFSLTIWFDKDNNNESFVWSNNVLTGLGSDSYILSGGAQNNVLSLNANSLFTSLNPGGGNYTLAQLQNGVASGINSATKIALWVGINTSNSSAQATINSLAVFHNTPLGFNYTAWSDQGVGYTAPASGDAYYPSAIYDANGFGGSASKYAMWYSDGAGGVFLVTSVDGVTWGTPVTMTGIPQAHHVQVLYDANCFGTLPCTVATTKYRIWFWDMGASLYSISSIATAESTDGIHWTNKTAATQNSTAKLIQEPDSGTGWNRGTYGPISVFFQPTAPNTGTEPWDYQYIMYYDGTDGGHEDTGLAYSVDGIHWNAYTVNPILHGSHVGGSQAWDCMGAVYGTVFHDSLGYHYFYSGSGQDNGSGGCNASASFNGIGYASSPDGKSWFNDPIPFFKTSDGVAYRNGRIYTPSIINDGSGVLRMYFSVKDSIGGPKKIAYATLTAPVQPPPPVTSIPTVTPPASSSGGVGVRPTTVTFSGKAFPDATILIVDKDSEIENVVSQHSITNPDGTFQVSFIGILQSQHSFGLVIKDKEGRTTQTKFFNIDTLTNDFVIKNILIPPTVGIPERLVTKGGTIAIAGYAAPQSNVQLEIDNTIKKNVTAEQDGSYKAIIATGELDFATHYVRAKQNVVSENKESDFSPTQTFVVSPLTTPRADLNGDERIDIKDWSIFLLLWASKEENKKKIIDLNGDGKVDIADFSIFIRTINNK